MISINSTILAGSLIFSCSLVSGTESPDAKKPNVIIIYTDDQGTIDMNSFGATDLATPNMDKIVNSGIMFTQFYGAPVCSPSRAGLLTGKTPQRAGIPYNVGPNTGLSSEQYTMAEMFKDAGYKTCHIGKWHLGHTVEFQPNANGFEYSFGHLGGCIDNYSHFFYWNGPNRHDLYRNGEEVYYDGQFFPDLMVKEAAEFMEKNRCQPFFIYFAINMPHYPYQGTPEWLEYYRSRGVQYPRDLYAAFLSTLDDKIGDLLNKLEELGLTDNTIIVFQSDNGHSVEERAHFGGGSAGIFRGNKASLFEGGIRVPAAISWPARLKAGEVRDQMAVNADWMPTLAELCGIDLDTKDLDGKSLVPIIQDNSMESLHSDGFCWQTMKRWVSRRGDWKLHGHLITPGEGAPSAENLFLVNLKDDPGEKTNLAEKYPEMVKELMAQYESWLERNQ
jgi:arylsulfatase A-like enzyme